MRCQLRPLTPPPSDMSTRSCRFSHCFVSPAEKCSFRECDFPSLGVPEWTWPEWTWPEWTWAEWTWPEWTWAECCGLDSLCCRDSWLEAWWVCVCDLVSSSSCMSRLVSLCACLCSSWMSEAALGSWLPIEKKKKKRSISIKKKNKKTFFEHILMASRGFWWLFTVFKCVVLQSKMQNAYCSVNTVERGGAVLGWWGGGRIS